MTIDLQKGQKIDLTKGNAGLTELMAGLGWDPAEQSSGGFLKGLLGGKNKVDIDCDSSVLLLNEQGKLAKKENLIYFGNLKSACGSVQHMGDNLTGGGDGDDEQVMIYLNKVPADVHRLVFVVNIYDCQNRKQDFGMIKNAFIRVVNKSDKQELARFNMSDDYSGKTALIVSEVYRYKGEWKFAALGEGTNDPSLSSLVQRYC
ncbi:MAG TPA: TerD family protein [Methylomusa anaerophila]|uniref:Stress response protein SCP2 n=1 Tax=Methylomusa anaerophila TaxID=1930071 RepID=A0A348AK61_9FIRM|nr:TerD family protein [Methylomusa anaerophila]BBB91459.1 stress response protein SCP2 [Methylomusa anaerophila]HML89951.1 TerD family protein [Methylomusa anaerophila]